MKSARYVIVDDITGEVVNAYTVEDSEHWPPTLNGMLTLADDTHKIGEFVETGMSTAMRQMLGRQKRNGSTGN